MYDFGETPNGRVRPTPLGELDGRWLCSYSDLPDGLDEYNVVGRDETQPMGNGRGRSTRPRERLVVSFELDAAE